MEDGTRRLTFGARRVVLLVAALTALFPLLLITDSAIYAQTDSSAELDAPALTAEAGEGAIELSWDAVSGAVRYELWTWWDDAVGWHQLDDGDLTGTTFSHSGLSAGTTYYYQARAVGDAGGTSEWSERVSATIDALQSSLAQPVLTAEAGEGMIELRWTPVSGAARYELWTWTSAEGWQQLDDGALTGTTYSHSGLSAGTTYYYGIRAVNEAGEMSDWAERVSATVPGSLLVPDAPEDRAALVALYEATDGADWRRSDNWLTEASIATWYGVTTDEQGRVTRLFLQNNGLSGPLPDLSALTSLTSLNLGINKLAGPIPELGALINLTSLSFYYNQLTGPIPDLSALTNLKVLYLHKNQLGGPIPDVSPLTGLTALYVSDNQLTGTIPDLSALTNLTWLDLGSNQLTGPVPDLCAFTNLKHVYLGSNQLDGPIPNLCALTNLTVLYLSNNQLTGPIPELSAFTSLRVLYLSNNQLTGPIPELGALTNLWRLSLRSNQLNGSIPELSGHSKLTLLDLSHNQLSGSIPELNALPRLTDLYLNDNRIDGPIPVLNALTSLTNLNLNSNQLTGSIPLLGTLTYLTSLDLSHNQLTGAIPDLSALSNLKILNLTGNKLSGEIPNLSLLTKLTGLYLRDNQLTGQIPDLSALSSLRWLLLDSNHLAGRVPDLSLLTELNGLNLSNNQLAGPVLELGFLTELTRLSLSHNQLTGTIPNLSALTKLTYLQLPGNQFCLPAESGLSGSNEFVSAHVENLSLPTCTDTELAAVPAVPQNLTATVGDGTVSLSWDAVAMAESYDLWAWDSIDRKWGPIGGVLSSTTYKHTVLTDGRNYNYQVRGRDADGERSPWSERVFAAVVRQQYPPPPLSLGLDIFFQKFLEVGGIAVVAPSEVPDERMVQAREIITGMLSQRSDLLEELASHQTRIAIHGYGGSAATPSTGWVGRVAQEDTHCGTFIREFASLIYFAVKEQGDGEQFNSRLRDVYQSALNTGLWKGRYASTSAEVYWAETVKYWFWESLPPSLAANYPKLADYDPEAALLIEEVLGDATVPPYCKP